MYSTASALVYSDRKISTKHSLLSPKHSLPTRFSPSTPNVPITKRDLESPMLGFCFSEPTHHKRVCRRTTCGGCCRLILAPVLKKGKERKRDRCSVGNCLRQKRSQRIGRNAEECRLFPFTVFPPSFSNNRPRVTFRPVAPTRKNNNSVVCWCVEL